MFTVRNEGGAPTLARSPVTEASVTHVDPLVLPSKVKLFRYSPADARREISIFQMATAEGHWTCHVEGKAVPNIAQSVEKLPSQALHAAKDALNSVLAEIVNPDCVAAAMVGITPVALGVRVVANPGIPVGPVGPVDPVRPVAP
jgi:hypothetical protein